MLFRSNLIVFDCSEIIEDESVTKIRFLHSINLSSPRISKLVSLSQTLDYRSINEFKVSENKVLIVSANKIVAVTVDQPEA